MDHHNREGRFDLCSEMWYSLAKLSFHGFCNFLKRHSSDLVLHRKVGRVERDYKKEKVEIDSAEADML